MTAFFITLNQLAIMVLMGSVGYFLKKKNRLTDGAISGLTFLLINVSMPSIVFASLQLDYTKERLATGILMVICTIAVMFMSYMIALVVGNWLKLKPDLKKVWIAGAMMSNSVFIGLPITKALFGDVATFYLCFISVGFNLVSYSYCIALFVDKNEEDSKIRRYMHILLTPAIVASLLGMLVFAFQIHVPKVLFASIQYFGQMTTPLAMLILGAFVSNNPIKAMFVSKEIYIFSALRLILIPIITLIIMHFVYNFMLVPLSPNLFSVLQDDIARNTIALSAAMPTATALPVFAERGGKNTKDPTSYCVVTTLLSLITLPIVSILITAF